ncbi:MAG: biotin-dependent carboxyltransferase family protein [Mycobacteriaceae bacterium]
MEKVLTVLATGPLALVQDRGRPGLGAMGVGRSGAADRRSHDLANRLVANDASAATIEVVLGGLAVRAEVDLTVAVTGAPAPVDVDQTPVGHASVLRLRAGSVLSMGAPSTGLRSYLAVRGGITVEQVLGSRATDTLSGLGPPPLEPGMVLPVGPAPEAVPTLDQAPVVLPEPGLLVLRARGGPRADWICDDLFGRAWTVSQHSDRIGARLDGEPLALVPGRGELPSEGVVRGAVQVPPSGQPVLFLADHPVTGGYPVVAIVIDADVDRAAQARPGQPIRFKEAH